MAFQKKILKKDINATNILKAIGFTNKIKIEKYLDKTQSIYGGYKTQEKTVWKRGKIVSSIRFREYTLDFCLKHLFGELNLKSKKEFIEKKIIDDKKFISATDLANFNFCPASYSVSKSFNIINFTNQVKTEIGYDFHEKLKLSYHKDLKDYQEDNFLNEKVFNDEKINKIKRCKLVFSGHNGNDEIFINSKYNYVGQPDYIFQDPNGNYFVVEEKFHYLDSDEPEIKKSFFTNHIVQLESYIKFINNYDIKYGVLIYWFYNFKTGYFEDGSPIINDVSIKVIKDDSSFDLLKKTYIELRKFHSQKKLEFINDINPYKCAACVVNLYCSHKTDKFTTVELPYNIDCLQTNKLNNG